MEDSVLSSCELLFCLVKCFLLGFSKLPNEHFLLLLFFHLFCEGTGELKVGELKQKNFIICHHVMYKLHFVKASIPSLLDPVHLNVQKHHLLEGTGEVVTSILGKKSMISADIFSEILLNFP